MERRGWSAVGRRCRDGGDALNLDVIFTDDAGGRSFRGECARGTRGSFNVEERDGLAVGRECRGVDVAVELAEANGGTAVEMREEEVGLVAWIGAVGEERDGGGVGRPSKFGRVAGLAWGFGDWLALGEIVERGEANLASLKPGDALAVGRDGELSEGASAVLGGKDLVELRGIGLRGCGLSVSEERRDEAEEEDGA